MTFVNFIVHLFLPDESNNHKPKVLHPHAFLFYITSLLILSFSFRFIHRTYPAVLGLATDISVSELLNLTNKERQKEGLPVLTINEKLSEAANLKAVDMFASNYWAHFSPEGKSPWDFIIKSDYQYSFAGENLAKDFSDSQGVVDAWIESPTHKANIIKTEYTDIGFAVVNGKINGQDTTLVVQMFGTLQPGQKKEANIELQNNKLVVNTKSPAVIAGIAHSPLIDINILNKKFSLVILGFLTFILTLDGILIYRRQTIRMSGHNIAHLLFFLTLGIIIWISARGTII